MVASESTEPTGSSAVFDGSPLALFIIQEKTYIPHGHHRLSANGHPRNRESQEFTAAYSARVTRNRAKRFSVPDIASGSTTFTRSHRGLITSTLSVPTAAQSSKSDENCGV